MTPNVDSATTAAASSPMPLAFVLQQLSHGSLQYVRNSTTGTKVYYILLRTSECSVIGKEPEMELITLLALVGPPTPTPSHPTNKSKERSRRGGEEWSRVLMLFFASPFSGSRARRQQKISPGNENKSLRSERGGKESGCCCCCCHGWHYGA